MQLRDALLAWSGAPERFRHIPMCILFRVCPDPQLRYAARDLIGPKRAKRRYAMICTACGKANTDGSAFCEQCGARMQAQPAASPRQLPVPAAPATAPRSPFAVPSSPPPRQMGECADRLHVAGRENFRRGRGCRRGRFLPALDLRRGFGEHLQRPRLWPKSTGAYVFHLSDSIGRRRRSATCPARPPLAKKLLYAGYSVLIGALCGPAILLSLLFVSQLSVRGRVRPVAGGARLLPPLRRAA